MRGAEAPADQLPAEAPVLLGWSYGFDGRTWYVDRLRNYRIVCRFKFNTAPEAFKALESYDPR